MCARAVLKGVSLEPACLGSDPGSATESSMTSALQGPGDVLSNRRVVELLCANCLA